MAIFCKIVLIGDGAVGKTALRSRFMGQGFSSNYLMTIGADMSVKQVMLPATPEPIELKFQIWDLAGQLRFSEVRASFYNGSVGAILVFDVTRPDSFENTPKWLMEMRKNMNKSIPVVILGNKVDLRSEVPNAVEPKHGRGLAKAVGEYYSDNKFEIPYYETSAKTGENVDNAFLKLASMILKYSSTKK